MSRNLPMVPMATPTVPAHDPHGINDGILYGPVTSRRYGYTYGINVLPPGEKRCDWNCVYCQLGYTDYGGQPDGYPSVEAIECAINDAEPIPGIDALVMCGNGEPTLHPRFGEIADVVRTACSKRFPESRLVCLTNGAELWRKPVREAMRHFDEVAVKLDAGHFELHRRVNLPVRPSCVTHQVAPIRRLHGAVIQACFFDGAVSNTSREAVTEWLDVVIRSMPTRVDIYTLSRDTPSGKLYPASASCLVQIGKMVTSLGIDCRVFGDHAQLALDGG